MNYWFIIDGNQVGPLTIEQAQALYPLSYETPVWYPNLPQWVTIADVPELASIVAARAQMPGGWQQPIGQQAYGPQPTYGPQPRHYGPQAFGPQSPVEHTRPCPQTYMAWSIVSTILCCLIPGIIAIIYSSKVTARYNSGDYIGAVKASGNAKMWILASVILGLVALPLTLLSYCV